MLPEGQAAERQTNQTPASERASGRKTGSVRHNEAASLIGIDCSTHVPNWRSSVGITPEISSRMTPGSWFPYCRSRFSTFVTTRRAACHPGPIRPRLDRDGTVRPTMALKPGAIAVDLPGRPRRREIIRIALFSG